MNQFSKTIYGVLIFTSAAFSAWDDAYQFPALRDPYAWPFKQGSIWNTPIGSNAKYVPAHIKQATEMGLGMDEDIIILSPSSPMVDIIENNAGWDGSKKRCNSLTGKLIDQVPIPNDFTTEPGYLGYTPNSGCALLKADGKTIIQNQPFHRCGVGGVATSQITAESVDITQDDGMYGSHGGSGLSTIGGTLRVGELIPGAPPIHHALKINLDEISYGCPNNKPFRWPALRGDACGTGDAASVEGALYALPPSIDIKTMGLETEPAKYLARAFQDYGAYAVDGSGWNVYCLITEWGPRGRVIDEFEKAWGFSIQPVHKDNAWSRDMDRIFLKLEVVDNNGPNSIGGGGTPRAPLAPANFGKPGSAVTKDHLFSKQAENRKGRLGQREIGVVNGKTYSGFNLKLGSLGFVVQFDSP